jgi:hypothetical protein
VEPLIREQPHWVLQPLVDAGLSLEEIGVLVFRFGFAAVVGEGRGPAAALPDPVGDQAPEVRAAWQETVGRMLVRDLLG